MKKLLFIILIGLIASCESNGTNSSKETSQNQKQNLKSDRLEIYAFHGTRQCATCKNMKKNTKATLDKYFSEEIINGTIIYQVVDVDEDVNYNLAEKFEATGTALMINQVRNNKDNIEDWSDFAFEKANNKTEYIEGLKTMIEKKLK